MKGAPCQAWAHPSQRVSYPKPYPKGESGRKVSVMKPLGFQTRNKVLWPHSMPWGAQVSFHPWERGWWKLISQCTAVFALCHTGELSQISSLLSWTPDPPRAEEPEEPEELGTVSLSEHGGDGWVWNLTQTCPERYWTSVAMIHFCLVHTAYHLHCWLPRSHRLRL